MKYSKRCPENLVAKNRFKLAKSYKGYETRLDCSFVVSQVKPEIVNQFPSVNTLQSTRPGHLQKHRITDASYIIRNNKILNDHPYIKIR